MTGLAQTAMGDVPEWVVAEMPPGYQNRLLEIERLSADLRAMDRIGSVLWATGDPLQEAVSAVFGALKCEPAAAGGAMAVTIGEGRRLLVLVSAAISPIQKTNEELAQVFQTVQFAGANDRVVLVVNNDPAMPPASRPDGVLSDALVILKRMGVNVVTTAMLFGLWRLSFEDAPKARKVLERLHAQDGGTFVMPPR